jgi:hypothetical protein
MRTDKLKDMISADFFFTNLKVTIFSWHFAKSSEYLSHNATLLQGSVRNEIPWRRQRETITTLEVVTERILRRKKGIGRNGTKMALQAENWRKHKRKGSENIFCTSFRMELSGIILRVFICDSFYLILVQGFYQKHMRVFEELSLCNIHYRIHFMTTRPLQFPNL